jgi:hypothetical protein
MAIHKLKSLTNPGETFDCDDSFLEGARSRGDINGGVLTYAGERYRLPPGIQSLSAAKRTASVAALSDEEYEFAMGTAYKSIDTHIGDDRERRREVWGELQRLSQYSGAIGREHPAVSRELLRIANSTIDSFDVAAAEAVLIQAAGTLAPMGITV